LDEHFEMEPELEAEQLDEPDVEETKEAGADSSDSDKEQVNSGEQDSSEEGESETERQWRLKREARLVKKEAREAEKDEETM
jgi:hypothetical protein